MGYAWFLCVHSIGFFSHIRCFSLLTLVTFSIHMQNFFFSLFSHPWTFICVAMFDFILALLINHNKPWTSYVYNYNNLYSREDLHTKYESLAFTTMTFHEPHIFRTWSQTPSITQILIFSLGLFGQFHYMCILQLV